MEHLEEDIESRRTLKEIKEYKKIILDCVTNIKSNDKTFKLDTLPQISDKFHSCMSSYISTYQCIEASHLTFNQLSEEIKTHEEDGPHGGESVELAAFENKFNEILSAAYHQVGDEAEAVEQLEAMLKPQDEDVVIEAPNAQQIPKDPYSKKLIKVAVKNTTCKHIYDKGTIENYISQREQSKSRCPCPVAGCQNKNIKRKDLVLDDETNKLIESLKTV